MEYVLKLAPLPISDTGELEHNLEIQKEGIDNAPINRDFNIHFNLFNVEYHNIRQNVKSLKVRPSRVSFL